MDLALYLGCIKTSNSLLLIISSLGCYFEDLIELPISPKARILSQVSVTHHSLIVIFRQDTRKQKINRRMFSSTATSLLALAGVASAHYRVLAPAWRANSLSTPGTSQWVYPCNSIPFIFSLCPFFFFHNLPQPNLSPNTSFRRKRHRALGLQHHRSHSVAAHGRLHQDQRFARVRAHIREPRSGHQRVQLRHPSAARLQSDGRWRVLPQRRSARCAEEGTGCAEHDRGGSGWDAGESAGCADCAWWWSVV